MYVGGVLPQQIDKKVMMRSLLQTAERRIKNCARNQTGQSRSVKLLKTVHPRLMCNVLRNFLLHFFCNKTRGLFTYPKWIFGEDSVFIIAGVAPCDRSS